MLVRPVRTSPSRWGLASCLPEMFAQVRLVGEAAAQRDVAQARAGLKHVLSRQLQAALDHERVG